MNEVAALLTQQRAHRPANDFNFIACRDDHCDSNGGDCSGRRRQNQRIDLPKMPVRNQKVEPDEQCEGSGDDEHRRLLYGITKPFETRRNVEIAKATWLQRTVISTV